MINIDDRLLSYVDSNEFWLLMQLAKRISSQKKVCWPSNKTLCKDTKWNIDKLQRVKKSLVDRGLLTVQRKRDNSNIYQIKTNHIGYYVNVTDVEFEEREGSTVESGKGSTVFEPSTSTVKSSNEVLTSEVLTTEPSEANASGELFKPDMVDHGAYPMNKSNKKGQKEKLGLEHHQMVYKPIVDFWLKDFHPDWSFSAVHGKAVKSIIRKMEGTFKAKGNTEECTPERLIDLFKLICKNLPEWFKDKDLQILDSKYNEIITQIENGKTAGKNVRSSTSTRWIDELYSRASR